MYDLIVLGGSAQGLSAAITAQSIGSNSVLILESGTKVAYPHLVGSEKLSVHYGESVKSIDRINGHLVIKTAQGKEYETQTCVVALNDRNAVVSLPAGIIANEKVHEGPFDGDVVGQDILIAGDNDRAVVLASKYVNADARSVVLAARGMNPDVLANASRNEIKQMEKDRKLTVLYRATVDKIETVDGSPLVEFSETHPPTPKLVFDHVVFAATQKLIEPENIGISESAMNSGRIMYARDPRLVADLPSGTCNEIIAALSEFFATKDEEKVKSISVHTRDYASAPEDLSEEFYNATITHFDPRHSDLWVLRVKPDAGDVSFQPGQYTTLGLGYWEPRVDDAVDPKIDEVWNKKVQRSYSISNRIFDERGYLAEGTENGELEFYIVLVPPNDGKVPGLTPRLALKKPGDRIFIGGKVTGHYTLQDVYPDDNVIFFATGTGEAPHNAMIVDLLRRGHRGKIISAVSVRNAKDLGYKEQHEKLQKLYSNYTYLPLPTREPGVPKRYCQDLVRDGDLEKIIGGELKPENTKVFACGNPAMIGAPDKEGNLPSDPGIVGLFVNKGFAIAGRKVSGQIHFDEYW